MLFVFRTFAIIGVYGVNGQPGTQNGLPVAKSVAVALRNAHENVFPFVMEKHPFLIVMVRQKRLRHAIHRDVEGIRRCRMIISRPQDIGLLLLDNDSFLFYFLSLYILSY